MNDDVDEIMYMCARMIHGISSALSNLSEEARLFDLDVEDIDILWDARGRVVLAIHPEVANSSTTLASPEDHTSRLLRMMDDICINVFRSVNRIRYDDEPDRTYTISSITQVDEDTSSLASSSQPSRTTVIQPRRELVWQAGAGRDTDLHKISQEYGSFVRRDRHFRQHVRRFHAQVGNPFLHHQCAAYQREDLTLTHAILDNKVVVYTVPSFGEVCVVCGTVSAGPPPPPPELIPPPEVPDSGSPPPVPSAGPPPPEPIPLPEVPPARPGWRTVNVRPSKKKKRDSGPPPPAAPPPGPYPRAQVREWAQWHPGSHFVPTPPTIDPYLLIPDQGGPGLFGPRSPRGSVIR
ncbi:hypothetical protein ARMSODRAFT_465260 [Armillaria solidipes]|uniref:Uncharacterized protein n=1 Tax=Armillaria solidipes TaxID=1076256 RepID=A0A2H3BBW8_9AGAR|nr:hypothetical protein ARMSODRAFT_465260 [Armillaria solidipes]